jgi:hypothetical protein
MTKLTRFSIAAIQVMLLCFALSSISYAAESKPAWQADWDKAIKAAEEEGSLTIYMTQAFEPVFRDGFQKKYPPRQDFRADQTFITVARSHRHIRLVRG